MPFDVNLSIVSLLPPPPTTCLGKDFPFPAAVVSSVIDIGVRLEHMVVAVKRKQRCAWWR
jgi:hypothetical protein